jgi:hypothetical protein
VKADYFGEASNVEVIFEVPGNESAAFNDKFDEY